MAEHLKKQPESAPKILELIRKLETKEIRRSANDVRKGFVAQDASYFHVIKKTCQMVNAKLNTEQSRPFSSCRCLISLVFLLVAFANGSIDAKLACADTNEHP